MGAFGILLIVFPFLAGFPAPAVLILAFVGLLIVSFWVYTIWYNYRGDGKDRFSNN